MDTREMDTRETGVGDFSVDKTLGGQGGERAWSLSEGETLGGCRVIRPLGRGGMGEVYLVEHEGLRKEYALKLILPQFSGNPDFIERFKREAQVTATLDHPNIARVEDFGSEGEHYWLRMELVEGVDARKFVNGTGNAVTLEELRRAAADERIPQGLAADILEQVLAALAYAHGKGAVHRDFKPGNVLLKERNGKIEAKVSDFGLVRLVSDEWLKTFAERSLSMAATGEQPDLDTAARSVVGTYEYMAPEQKEGRANEASDVYAVGLAAYRLLTGRRELALKSPSALVHGLDPKWDRFLTRALEEDPAARFADAAEALAALRAFKGDLRDASPSPAPGTTVRPADGDAVRLDVLVEKRLEVEGMREDFEKTSDEAEADILDEIDRDIKVAREIEGRDHAAALEHFERAAQTLRLLEKRRRLLAEKGWPFLKKFDAPEKKAVQKQLAAADELLRKRDHEAAEKSYEAFIPSLEEAVRNARESRKNLDKIREDLDGLKREAEEHADLLARYNEEGYDKYKEAVRATEKSLRKWDAATAMKECDEARMFLEEAVKAARKKKKRRTAIVWHTLGGGILGASLGGVAPLWAQNEIYLAYYEAGKAEPYAGLAAIACLYFAWRRLSKKPFLAGGGLQAAIGVFFAGVFGPLIGAGIYKETAALWAAGAVVGAAYGAIGGLVSPSANWRRRLGKALLGGALAAFALAVITEAGPHTGDTPDEAVTLGAIAGGTLGLVAGQLIARFHDIVESKKKNAAEEAAG